MGGGGTQSILKVSFVQVWDALGPADMLLVREIMTDNRIVGTVHHAWAMTLRDGLERSFWIVRKPPSGFATGHIWTGTNHNTPRNAYAERLLLANSLEAVVANYHTHPGSEWVAAYPSEGDANYNRKSNTIGFLQSEFGFSYGRTTHRESRRSPR